MNTAFYWATACTLFACLLYSNQGDMTISSFVISNVARIILPYISPLDTGWDKDNIHHTRKLMEPIRESEHPEVRYLDIPLDPSDHRNAQESYLLEEDRILYRIYVPTAVGFSQKVVIWFHGGGFVLGNIRADHDICNKISMDSSSIVVSVNYALSPENRFPVAVDDSIRAVKWVYTNIKKYGGDKNKIFLAGESAGGNLAISIVPNLGPIQIKGVVTIYPPLQAFSYSNSHWKYANANGFLPLSHMIKMHSLYLPNASESTDDRASPLWLNDKKLKQFPPVLIILAKYDILYGDGVAFAERLMENKVNVVVRSYPDIHGFFGRFGHGNNAFNDALLFIYST